MVKSEQRKKIYAAVSPPTEVFIALFANGKLNVQGRSVMSTISQVYNDAIAVTLQKNINVNAC